jgi:DNA-binding SARP family transcriptional activator/Tfp pilus assembly protein PilF
LPLALELAAARVRLLTVEQIAERLDDAFHLLTRGTPAHIPRHQALRATMGWTYQFLTAPEQVLLRRLSVFAGSFTLEMVEAVCRELNIENEDLRNSTEHETACSMLNPQSSILDLLSNLVDKSFVSPLPREGQSTACYRLLEPVRQYAREQLELSGEAVAVRTRLLEWVVALAERAEPYLRGGVQAQWLQRIEAEHDNVRAALRWACTSQQVELGLRLANVIWRFWFARNYLTEGRAWLEELLRLEANVRETDHAKAAPLTVRAQALFASGRLACRQSDDEQARLRGEASLALFREIGDRAGIVVSLNLLALVAADQHRYHQATASYEEALALSRESNDRYNVAMLLTNLGLMYHEQGDLPHAARLYEEVLATAPRTSSAVSTSLGNLGELAVKQGDYARARSLLEQRLAIDRELGNTYASADPIRNLGELARYEVDLAQAEQRFQEALELTQHANYPGGIGEALNGLGDVARDRGQIERARDLYEQSLAHCRRVGFSRGICIVTTGLGRLEALQGNDEQAARRFRESARTAHAAGLGHTCVEALEQLASVLARQGDPRRAARLLAATATRRTTIGTPVPPPDRAGYDDTIVGLRAALGDTAYERIQDQARNWTLDQAVSEALSTSEPEPTLEPLGAAGPAPKLELRVYALGPTRVIVGARTLASTDWTYAKSRELCFYFLAQPPATKAQIGLDLWPDASDEQLRSQFHRALHHLRKALGHHEWILFSNGTYTFNRAAPYWCDLHIFEVQLREAQALLRAGPPPAERPRAVACLEEATQLWRGDYLANLDAGEWAVFRREELRQAFLQALLDLGQLHFADAHYAAAAGCYRRVLAYDNYLELAHRELMRCNARQGEVGQALRQYQALRQLLRDELDADPSAETTLLYERLRRGDDV